MSLAERLAAAQRAIERNTLGAVVRMKAARADNQDRIAEIVNLRARNPQPLSQDDFIAAGLMHDVEPAKLHAIADTETSGAGFDNRLRAIPAIEPHAFSCATHGAFDRSHPHLSYPEWIPYRRGDPPPAAFRQHPYTLNYDDRWGLFAMQAELDFEGACEALSLGRFQQLVGRTPSMKRRGEPPNWKLLGFKSAEILVRTLAISEAEQMEVFLLFLRAHGLMAALRAGDWHTVTRVYNGPGQVAAYSAKAVANYKIRSRSYPSLADLRSRMVA